MQTAIIIDDELMARTLLQGMLEEYCKDIRVTASCNDLPSGVKSIRKLKPDIVFLDIEMPGHSGLELLDFFDEEELSFSIVFTTAYNQYAIQAFRLSAIDYLLKPVAPDELEAAVARCLKEQNRKNYTILKQNLETGASRKLAIYTVDSIKFIETTRILFLKAEGAYTHVMLSDGSRMVASRSLKVFEDMLSGNDFFYRCHKSYIVNLAQVTDYVKADGGYLIVTGKYEVSVSSEKTETVLKKIAAL